MATFGQQTTRWIDNARREKPNLFRLKSLHKENRPEPADRSITIILYGILFPSVVCGLLAITLFHLHPHSSPGTHQIEWPKILLEGAAFAGLLLIAVVLSIVVGGGTQQLLKKVRRKKTCTK
ncbi:hypothetical protein [Terriglobus saanensis]|uniref:Uncharacterized protein n=1 Tax=Terriglobus saanensis (strain ATCC BAA-1853 / DSM 23119 / SP1PR4) TaxID=401053 RepID=E8V8T4_TERSS|nr:hypothetical protein [Terriglobus saanensis]ADV84121.1 hypothetical protein AciPR4_3367 [Terriglobus saanensis SP1PR4]